MFGSIAGKVVKKISGNRERKKWKQNLKEKQRRQFQEKCGGKCGEIVGKIVGKMMGIVLSKSGEMVEDVGEKYKHELMFGSIARKVVKKIAGNRVRKIEGNIVGKMGKYGGENGGKVERKY